MGTYEGMTRGVRKLNRKYFLPPFIITKAIYFNALILKNNLLHFGITIQFN